MRYTKQIAAIPLRIPDELKIWLKARAAANFRSVNAEIIAMLLDERRKEGEAEKEDLKQGEGLTQEPRLG